METKPWSMATFPKDRTIYIKQKSGGGLNLTGAELIVSIAPFGVNVFVADDKGNVKAVGITWAELHATCITYDGHVCGVKR